LIISLSSAQKAGPLPHPGPAAFITIQARRYNFKLEPLRLSIGADSTFGRAYSKCAG
jgi:hypothetical protein